MMAMQDFGVEDKRLEKFHTFYEGRYPLSGSDHLEPSARCLMVEDGNLVLARASYEVVDRVGLIGHYEADDPEAGVAVLQEAVQRLASCGVTQVLGPINGNTWYRYRLMLPGTEDSASPFFTEPVNDFRYPSQFEAAGFQPFQTYQSRVVNDLEYRPRKVDRIKQRVEARGITVRSLDLNQFDALLKQLFAMAVESFAENLFYRPITFEQFYAMYKPLEKILDPDLVPIAYDPNGEIVTVGLAYPDLLSGQPPTRLIYKTLATVPRLRRLGLAFVCIDWIHQAARRKGYQQVIHALMHEENASLRMSTDLMQSEPFRRYALFKKNIG